MTTSDSNAGAAKPTSAGVARVMSSASDTETTAATTAVKSGDPNESPSPASTKRAPAVGFIFITVLIDLIGIGLIIPVLPGVVGSLTPDPMHQAYWYGALTATYGLAQFFCSPLLGALSDRYGRRPLLLLGIAGMGVNFFVTATAQHLWLLLLSRLVGGGFSANLAVANAYIADISAPDQRARRFGLLGAAIGLGFIIGPALGGWLGEHNLRWPFFAAALLCLMNWLYGLFVLPESLPQARRRAVRWREANPLASLLHLTRLKGVGELVGASTLANLAQFVLHTTFVLYTGARFGWGPQQNGYALFTVGVVSAIVQGGLIGRVLKRLGRERAVVLGMASSTLAYLLYGLATQGWMMYLIIIGNVLSYCAMPAMQGAISEAAHGEEQGYTLGAVSSLNSLMTVIAPLLGAPLFAMVAQFHPHDWRIGAPFFLSSVLSCLALALALRYFHRWRTRLDATVLAH